jgi:hypothetical protein
MKATPSATPILSEVIPPYILGTRLSSRNQAIGLVWGLRFAGMILTCLFAVALHIGSTSAIAVVVSIFGIFLIFLYSEVVGTKYVKSATPIVLFSNGIQVPILYYDRLHGLKKFIPFEDIAFVEIDRRDVYQMMVFRNGKGIKWLEAPVSMKIHLRTVRNILPEQRSRGRSSPSPRCLTTNMELT